ncbi:hypothetical protein QJS10_CPA06g02273 [Acorus calamus]|uniref:Mic1 domain-containing protein n=1 Tax=Acorus calamus TaxID=4465 RepID=A0AAV9EMM3_ACOCL|nr:hypothetical protein QJS10_CPA06g02273 [Acorus calamus]
MLGNMSSDQSKVSLSGSGALSHVYIQHPPLRCSIPGTRGLFYDDGNKLLLIPTSDQVFSWKTSPASFTEAPNSDSIGEGPVLSIRYSLDGKIIGIQRSSNEVQFVNRETGSVFSQRCRSESERLLGFFWTDCPTCDVAFIKTSGLELFTYESVSNSLHLVETKRLNVSWYVYTHESRMVLLACGMQCKLFSSYQFSSVGIIRLPKFEMTMTAEEANRKPVLAADDVHIVTVYGRIYSLQTDKGGMLLHLYRFYRDAVVHQGSLPIYSTRIAVSVVDNVILIHHVDAKVVILYDMFPDSLTPISAPLPLLLRGTSKVSASSSHGNTSRKMVQVEVDETTAYGTIYGDGWIFLIPDLICDVNNGMLWRIHLDLEAIAASSSEVPFVLEFLQRRRSEPNQIKQLCLAIMRSIILERRSLSLIARAIDVLVASFSLSMKIGNNLQGGAGRVTAGNHTYAGSQNAPSSGNRDIDRSTTVSDEAIRRVETHGKSVGQRPVAKEEKELALDVADVSHNMNAVSRISEASAYVVSDPEENVHLEISTTKSGEILESSLAGDLASGSMERRNQTSPETLQPDTQFPLESGESSVNSNEPSQKVSQVTHVAISPDEMYHSVFTCVEEEMTGDPACLIAVIVEFFRSASVEKLKVHPNLYVMTIQLLARNERYVEIELFIINKIVEPSKEVALQLLDSGRQIHRIRKLGMDMLRKLYLHHDYVMLLMEDGYYLEALRYARKNKVTSVQASVFLEAAFAANNPEHLTAVLRFLVDFIPGFKTTSEHSMYSRILSNMY